MPSRATIWAGTFSASALGARLSEWVRRDLTGSTAWARHVCRALVQCAVPAALLVLLLPGPLGLRFGTAMLGVIVALYYSTTYLQQILTGRLVKHGWPADLGVVAKERREADVRRAADAAYAAAWRTPADGS
jgi:hypothetical protein